MPTVTILPTQNDRLRALGVVPWTQRLPASEAFSLAQAPLTTRWLFLLDAMPQDSDSWQTPSMTLFTGILRALNESPETVAWGEVRGAAEANMLAERFIALKTIVLFGEQAARRFFKTSVPKVLSIIPAWEDKFCVLVAPTLAQLQEQPDAKRWLWQQLQQANK